METHKRLLGILHIVYGAGALIIFLVINTIIGTVLPIIQEEIPTEGFGYIMMNLGLTIGKAIAIVVAITVPIPSIVGGFATLNQKTWGLTLLMLPGCVSLLSFPLGTALGVYTIWVFIESKKEK